MFRGSRTTIADRPRRPRRYGRRIAVAAGLLAGGADVIPLALDGSADRSFFPSAAAKTKTVAVPAPVKVVAPPKIVAPVIVAPKIVAPAPAAAASPVAKAATSAPAKTATPAASAQPAQKSSGDSNGDGIPDSKQDANGDGVPDFQQAKATGDDANGDGIPDSKQGGARPATADAGRASPQALSAEPPATIAEWWKRVNAPAPPSPPPPAPAAAMPAPKPVAVPAFKETVRDGKGKIVAAPPPADAKGRSVAAPDPAKGDSRDKTSPPAAGPAAASTAAAASAKAAVPRAVAGWQRGAPPPPLPPPGTYRQNEVVATNLTPTTLQQALDLGFKLKSPLPAGGVPTRATTLIPPGKSSAAEAQSLLSSIVPPKSIGYNRIYRISPQSEGLHAVAPAQKTPCTSERCYGPSLISWSPELAKCARNLKIGVIDTFVDRSHPTFADKSIHESVMHPGKERPVETAHGTGVVAVLAGGRRSGTPGLIPDAQYYTADIFYADVDGAPMSDTDSMLNALGLMDSFDVQILNMSVAGPRDPLVEQAIEKLTRRGVIVVAAAGNDGPTGAPSYPAAYKNVIAVTAVSKELSGYRYATRGDYVDLAAPGVDIWTAVPGGKEGFQTGTSFAVPYATSVIASLYSALPRKSKEAVLATLQARDLGSPGRDPVFGKGLLAAPASCTPDKSPLPRAEPEVAGRPAPQPPAGVEASLIPARAESGGKSSLTGGGASPNAWSPISTFTGLPTAAPGSVGPAARR
jgi:hypothetical protein